MTVAVVLETLDPNSGSMPQRIASMASRFIARQSRSKLLDLRNAPAMVTFTFDDVPASACQTGAVILEKYGARGTFYVAGKGCGSASADGPLRASFEQLRTIRDDGHEIGCHTFSHPAVRYLSLDQLGVDLDHNQSALGAVGTGIAVRNFAYPYGDVSVRTKRYLEGRFDSCRSGHAGINRKFADLGALDAWPLEDALLDRTKVAALIDDTARHGGWLIFYSHDVAERPTRYGVTPGLLEWAVSKASDAGCILPTVAGGLQIANGLSDAK
jgi:peptidoglycan/xylan/chitin deacetylase (PgdA/CDA1 family)